MPHCRICNSSEEFQSIRSEFIFGGKDGHRFWQCQKCDLIYMFPPISEEEEKIFYKKEFEKFMASRSGRERDWSNAESHIKTNQDQVKRRWKYLKEHLSPGKELLEIGCSSGFMLDSFRNNGLVCTGIEPSGEFTEFLKKNNHPVFDSMIALQSSKPEKKFDLVVHFFVFEHIRNPFEFLTENLDALKVGGKIIAEIPCANDPLISIYNISAFEKFYWSIAHHYYYTPKSLTYILDKMGLKYQLIPEQRYDLSNHIVWMTEGKPGGQGRYNSIFSYDLINQYQNELKNKWLCDTIILIIEK